MADFFELAELMCLDALHRNESCGGHFREEYQTPDGEALRDDDNFSYVAAWEYQGDGRAAGAEQGAAGIRVRASRASGATSKMKLITCTSGGRRTAREPRADGPLRSPTT